MWHALFLVVSAVPMQNLLHSITLDGNVVYKGLSERVNVSVPEDLKVHGGAGANRRYMEGTHQAKKIRL